MECYFCYLQLRSKQLVSYEDSYGSKKNDSSEINYSSPFQPRQIQNDFQGNFLENAKIPAHELPFVEEPNLLQQYKDSGLSSSTYELSQYIGDSSNNYEAAPSKDWSPIQGGEVFKAINLWDEEDEGR
ncbi:hypothetical protein JD844_017282 [Phrynosoma platyrhinos]|uniref:Uncharacterized protein n=1 Tax=Phrynosoma platyrhinos TaxID=52577 RepID=A0ABQ7SLP2_PHRPL|nr:hypothetical protein JD844_017282 [Phrynosoma platyrhinos]